MKKILLVSLIAVLGVTVIGCGNVKSDEKKEEIVSKQDINDDKYLTQEEMNEIEKNQDKHLQENIKYRFAKILSVEDTKISVEFLKFNGDYNYKGYNEVLDIDTSKLEGTEENAVIDIIGANTNFMDINSLKEGEILRIGNYEKPSDEEMPFEDGMILSIDII